MPQVVSHQRCYVQIDSSRLDHEGPLTDYLQTEFSTRDIKTSTNGNLCSKLKRQTLRPLYSFHGIIIRLVHGSVENSNCRHSIAVNHTCEVREYMDSL